MSDFLATQSLWLVPTLAGLLLLSLGLVLWLGLKARKVTGPSQDALDDAFEGHVEKSELEVKLVEQADRMRLISDV
ncbi:MAG: hypothetical protein O3B98_04500, partial [Actinobacteria bacterium]|nr:hypothetical protein [Actinomycetota bacterium]